MATFFKVLVLVFLILILAAIASYIYFQDRIFDKLEAIVTEEFTKNTGKAIEIGSIRYIPLQTIVINGVNIFGDNRITPVISADKIYINPDIIQIFNEKRLLFTAAVKNLKIKNAVLDITFKSDSLASPSIRGIFDPKLIDNIGIIDASLKIEKKEFNNINGTLDIKDLEIDKGKLFIDLAGKGYALSFSKDYTLKDMAYDISLRTDYTHLTGKIIKRENNIIMEDISGDLYSSEFYLGGTIFNFAGNERTFDIKGSLDTTFDRLKKVPWRYSALIDEYKITGPVKAAFNVLSSRESPFKFDFAANINVEEGAFLTYKADGLSFSIKRYGRDLTIENLKASIFDGYILASVSLVLNDEGYPDIADLDIQLNKIDINSLLKSRAKTAPDIHGRLSLETALSKEKPEDNFQGGSGPQIKYSFYDAFKTMSGKGKIKVSDFLFNKIFINSFDGNFSVKDGIIVMPEAKAGLYGGSSVLSVIYNLGKIKMPYEMTAELKDIELDQVISGMSGEKSKITGSMKLDLFMKGHGFDQSSIEGYGAATVTGANLGPMPLLAPLIGDLYSSLETIFTPSRIIQITAAYATFDIASRTISTEDMVLWGDDIYIDAYGKIDFDSNVDFYFQNNFKEPEEGKEDSWQTVIRDSIVAFGKTISKAHLSGTLKEPKWEFEYLIKDIISQNIQKFIKGISE